MSNAFSSYVTSSGPTLRDYQHAARMFTDDNLRLAPKLKFQFHVNFSINTAALKNIGLAFRHANELNMLVKSTGLPNFNMSTETIHQYNRKKIIQTKIEYQPITMKFHDDNFGVINTLWQNYYSYYFADSMSSQIPGTYNRTAMLGPFYQMARYGLDNNSSVPFFNAITIYQMARGDYVSYRLVNPIITNWNHEGVDHASSNPHENSMTIAYETVNYGAGKIQQGDPAGFATEHYDSTPSPLKNGAVDLNTIYSAGTLGPDAAATHNAVQTVSNYEQARRLAVSAPRSLLGNTAVSGISGIGGISFPKLAGIAAVGALAAKAVKLF